MDSSSFFVIFRKNIHETTEKVHVLTLYFFNVFVIWYPIIA